MGQPSNTFSYSTGSGFKSRPAHQSSQTLRTHTSQRSHDALIVMKFSVINFSGHETRRLPSRASSWTSSATHETKARHLLTAQTERLLQVIMRRWSSEHAGEQQVTVYPKRGFMAMAASREMRFGLLKAGLESGRSKSGQKVIRLAQVGVLKRRGHCQGLATLRLQISTLLQDFKTLTLSARSRIGCDVTPLAPRPHQLTEPDHLLRSVGR